MGSKRDPRMDLIDYRPDVYGLVRGPRDAPPQIVKVALGYQCPDCVANVFIERDFGGPGIWGLNVAHDDTCPWLTRNESKKR